MKFVNKSLSLVVSSLAIPFGLSVAPAQAQFASFFGAGLGFTEADMAEQQYQNFLGGGIDAEDFESFPAGTTNPTLTFGSVTADLLGSGVQVNDAPLRGASNTTRPLDVNTNYIQSRASQDAGSTFGIDFSEPVQGFGFYATDIGDFGAQLSINLFLGGNLVDSVPVNPGAPPRPNGEILFQGIVGLNETDVFDSVLFSIDNAESGDTFGFDDFSVVMAGEIVVPPEPNGTPEPSALIGLGLLGTAGFVSRRKRK